MDQPVSKEISLKHKRPWILLMSAVVLLSADRWFKGVAIAAGEEGLMDNMFGLPIDFRLFLNPGIAFSLPLSNWIYWPATILIGGALLYLLKKTWKQQPFISTALVFIILGGLSNVIDRVLVGSVIDYFIFFNLSAVNIADGMIVEGAIVAYLLMKKYKRKPPTKKPGARVQGSIFNFSK